MEESKMAVEEFEQGSRFLMSKLAFQVMKYQK